MKRATWFGSVVGAGLALGSLAASAQTVALSAGFMPDPRTLGGVAGGPVQASVVNARCRGFVPPAAQHRVVLQTPMPFFRVWASSVTDVMLLVRAPNGQIFCADDTWGTNPGVDILSAIPGTYEVFVGTYAQGTSGAYTVGFSELRTSQPPSAAPMQLAAPPPSLGANPCGGSQGVAMPPPANPCGGENPGIEIGAPPMMPAAPPAMAPVQPAVVVGAPTVMIGGARGGVGYPLQSGFLPDPRMFSGISGGPVSAQAVSPACRGYINTVPNHAFQLTSNFNFLRLWVRSSGDTTMLVRAPTGQVFCADDTYGLNPGVDLNALPPGIYQVFVGSYSAGVRTPYELAATENPSSTPGPTGGYISPAQQPPPARNNYGAVMLTSGFLPDPQMRNGASGGQIPAVSMNASCRGFIDARPDHVMYLNSPFSFLRVYVDAQNDTTLFIRGPNGEVWCADDTFGLNPAIDLQGAMPGQYQIFVGSFAEGDTAPYTIGFTEQPNVHP